MAEGMLHLEGALRRLRIRPLRGLIHELLPTDEAAMQDLVSQLLSDNMTPKITVWPAYKFLVFVLHAFTLEAGRPGKQFIDEFYMAIQGLTAYNIGPGMGRTGSTVPAVHTSPRKFRTCNGLEVLFL